MSLPAAAAPDAPAVRRMRAPTDRARTDFQDGMIEARYTFSPCGAGLRRHTCLAADGRTIEGDDVELVGFLRARPGLPLPTRKARDRPDHKTAESLEKWSSAQFPNSTGHLRTTEQFVRNIRLYSKSHGQSRM